MTDDTRLLRQYTEARSESSFRELVERHINLVYSAALRVLNGDTHLAEDATQTVFADLARKAGELPTDVLLAGWLHRHTCFTASKMVRTERRRQAREQTAMEMKALESTTDAGWDQIRPVLDEALNQLETPDRDAIVLRFLKQQDLRSVGDALGLSDDAAQKRVSRALEKLRTILDKRGITATAAALAAVLTAEAATAAPMGLAAAVAGAALAGTAITTSIGITAMKLASFSKVQIALAGLVLAAGVATPLLLQHQSVERLRHENADLSRRANDLDALRRENQRLSALIAETPSNSSPVNQDELLRLRGEVGMLRRSNQDLAETQRSTAPQPRSPLSPFRRPDQLSDVGQATPEAALETLIWAGVSANTQRVNQVVDMEKMQKDLEALFRKVNPDLQPGSADTFHPSINLMQQENYEGSGYQLLSEDLMSTNEANLQVAFTATNGLVKTNTLVFRQIGADWKLDLVGSVPPDMMQFHQTTTSADGSSVTQNIPLTIRQTIEPVLNPPQQDR